jgi:2-polyprenyl-3-methyl-5-hydroxy-6-metoxy-1,4-benzoquinol methylase
MSDENASYTTVNLDDPRQDVHLERKHDPNLHRYKVAEELLPTPSAGLRVLEIGGGIAEFSRRMLSRGIDVTFVDLSDHNLRKAEALGMEAHKIDLNTGLPPFDEGQFDGVVILEVIEHVVAAELLLREINRVLKPGGFLILSTPNFAFFINRFRILAGKLSMDEGYHYRYFTPSSLEKQMAEAGLEVDRHAHTMPAIGINIVRNRVMGKPRLHLHIPRPLASFFAHTLFVRARKVRSLGVEAR